MKILVVEDNQLLGKSLKLGLQEMGWLVDLVETGEEGLRLAKSAPYHVLLVDRMLPKLSGTDMLLALRAAKVATPAIILTAMSALEDVVAGLDVADDYLVKPVAMAEIVARIKALHRRALTRGENVVTVGDLKIEIDKAAVRVGDRLLTLTAKEYDILEALAGRPNTLLSRSELTSILYPFEASPDSNSVDVLLARLRRKLEESSVKLVTIRRKGWMLHVE